MAISSWVGKSCFGAAVVRVVDVLVPLGLLLERGERRRAALVGERAGRHAPEHAAGRHQLGAGAARPGSAPGAPGPAGRGPPSAVGPTAGAGRRPGAAGHAPAGRAGTATSGITGTPGSGSAPRAGRRPRGRRTVGSPGGPTAVRAGPLRRSRPRTSVVDDGQGERGRHGGEVQEPEAASASHDRPVFDLKSVLSNTRRRTRVFRHDRDRTDDRARARPFRRGCETVLQSAAGGLHGERFGAARGCAA